MYTLAATIVNRRWAVLVIIVCAVIFSAFSFSWVNLEEDLTYYLQDSAEAKKGLTIMNNEFVTYATARVMTENISKEEALELADRISELDGIIRVDYAGDYDHYRNDCALFGVTFSASGEEQESRDAMNRLEDLLKPYETYIYSDSFNTLNETIATEMAGVLVIVIFVVIGVLIFTSSSYGEILVLLATFVVAAVLNMGSNFILGTMSFISYTVAVVLQLALSVDYAIILCNRYKEERKNLPINEAVITALAKSIPSISASSLTTVAGLTAMTFMEFGLGVDMGIALIKSILFSLLSVFIFMPVMLSFCGRMIDRTAHRNFVPKVPFMGKFAYATRYIVPIVFIAVIVLAYMGFNNSYYGYSMDSIETAHKNEQDIVRERIEERFGKNNMLVVLVPSGNYEKEAALTNELSACREVKSILGLAGIEAVDGYKLADRVNYRQIMELADIDETMAKALVSYCAADRDEYREVSENIEDYSVPLIDMFLSLRDIADSGKFELEAEQRELIDSLYGQLKMAQDQLQGEQYSRLILYVDLPDQGEKTFNFLDRVHGIAEQYYEEGAVLTGNAVSAKDFSNTFERDNSIVSILSIVLVMLILLLTFKSVGMPLLLILVIQGSIWLNFAIPAWRGENVFFMCFLIVTAIQMGANIDYAIVISTRYSELRDGGMEQKEAIIETLNLAFPTVITSGLMMVVAGLLIGARVSQCVIAGMGKYVGTGTSISLVLVNFVLPQILLFGDGFARATTIKLSGKRSDAERERIWRRIAAALTVAAALVVLILAPINMRFASDELKKEETRNNTLISHTNQLRKLSDELSALVGDEQSEKIEFAEHLLTDKIGSEELEEGIEEYEAGAVELEEYKVLLENGEEAYRSGYEQYLAGLSTYLEGKAQLEAGQEAYNIGVAQYEAGQEQLAAGQGEYDEGLAQYEAGQERLAAGQAEYDTGLAQYEAGKAELERGQQLLAAVEPLYNAVVPLYDYYQSLQTQYDEMKAAENTNPVELMRLRLEVESARMVFEGALGGYSIGGLLEEYRNAQAQIAEGQAQLAEAEAQLAAGKAELDAGYAELAEAEAQLAAAQAELDAGYAELAEAEAQLAAAQVELDAGYAQLKVGKRDIDSGWAELEAAREELDEGKKQIEEGETRLAEAGHQIEEGRASLEKNRAELEMDLETLDRISDDREKLNAGIEILRSIEAVSSRAGKNATAGEICSVANRFFDEQLIKFDRETTFVRIVSVLLIASGVMALASILLHVIGLDRVAAIFASLTVIMALAAALIWRIVCRSLGQSVFWSAALLSAAAALETEVLRRLIRQD